MNTTPVLLTIVCRAESGEQHQHSMHQNRYLEADCRSFYQEISRLFGTQRYILLPCAQQPVTRPHSEPDESIPHLHIPILRSTLIVISNLSSGLLCVTFCEVLRIKCLSLACYMFCPYNLLDSVMLIIRLIANIIMSLVMLLSTSSCVFCLTHLDFPQNFFLVIFYSLWMRC
jgi:hypothetical protein